MYPDTGSRGDGGVRPISQCRPVEEISEESEEWKTGMSVIETMIDTPPAEHEQNVCGRLMRT